MYNYDYKLIFYVRIHLYIIYKPVRAYREFFTQVRLFLDLEKLEQICSRKIIRDRIVRSKTVKEMVSSEPKSLCFLKIGTKCHEESHEFSPRRKRRARGGHSPGLNLHVPEEVQRIDRASRLQSSVALDSATFSVIPFARITIARIRPSSSGLSSITK